MQRWDLDRSNDTWRDPTDAPEGSLNRAATKPTTFESTCDARKNLVY